MKRHWLRGMLLGVTLALLLAGGVALAQALTLTVDQDCFECWPGTTEPDDEHVVVVTADGYHTEADLCAVLGIDSKIVWDPGCLPEEDLSQPPCEVRFAVDCERMWLHTEDTCYAGDEVTDAWQPVAAVTPGDLLLTAWQEVDEDPIGPVRQVAFTFAAVCAEEAVEFVPELGTLALLGSGLAGLAGYATLRWRARN